MTLKFHTHTLLGFRHTGNPSTITRTPGMTMLRLGPYAVLHINSRKVH